MPALLSCENPDVRPPPRILSQISIFSGIRTIPLPSPPATNYIFPQITSEVPFNGHTQRGKIYERPERAERSAPFENGDHETKISRVVPKESVCVSIGRERGRQGPPPPPEEPPSVARLSSAVRLGSCLETSVESRS